MTDRGTMHRERPVDHSRFPVSLQAWAIPRLSEGDEAVHPQNRSLRTAFESDRDAGVSGFLRRRCWILGVGRCEECPR